MGAALVGLYRGEYPAKSPYPLYAQMVTDAGFRRFAWAQASAKAAQGGAPVWMYRWDWPSPAWDGRFGAAHAIDVPASFGHVRDALLGAGAGTATASASATGRRLASILSESLARFAAKEALRVALSPIGRNFPQGIMPVFCWGRI